MAKRLLSSKFALPPSPSSSPSTTSILSLFNCKRRKKLKKKLASPRLTPIHKPTSQILPHFESILHSDSLFRFLTRTRRFLRRLPHPRLLPLSSAGKLHHELGFPRGRKIHHSISRHPLLFQTHNQNLAFTPLMEELIREEDQIVERMMGERVKVVRKLLMMSVKKRIGLNKLYHCRGVFGLPDDFRERVGEYGEWFRVKVDEGDGGRHVLELVEWDDELAVSKLERDFVTDEDRVRKTFKFPIPHGKSLSLDEDDERKMNSLSTLPLISPYSDGSNLKPWSVEAEKYRVGLIHEFLSLTLEKRAMIHHIVEFKEDFNLTKHTYQMMLKQPRAFYLAGTEMNWGVFLREAYKEDGTLIEKDPQVVFEEKLRKYALMKEGELVKGEIKMRGKKRVHSV